MTSRLADLSKVPHTHVKIRKIYGRILQLMRKLPRDAAYKVNTEAIICHRLSILNEAGDDVRKIEQGICGGNIHMILRQAEDEYALLQKMLFWKVWEPLADKPPPNQWDWPPC